MSLVESVIKRKAINENWRRGRKFSSNAFIASLDPRWKFVTDEVKEMQLLCQFSLYHEEFDLEELVSGFTSDQMESLLPGGGIELTIEQELNALSESRRIPQNV